MFSTATVLAFTNGFYSVTSYSEDTLLWMLFVALMGLFTASVYLANQK